MGNPTPPGDDVTKIATTIPISREMLADFEAVGAYYDELAKDVTDGPRYGPPEPWDGHVDTCPECGQDMP